MRFTFKQYLTDRRIDESVPQENVDDHSQMAELLLEHCSQALHSSTEIYRGTWDLNTDIGMVQHPQNAEGKRPSAYTTNHYNALVSNLPNWKAFPRRDKSLICSTARKYTRTYGTVCRVFPFDGVKIGICPQIDFWFSFEHMFNETRISERDYPAMRHFNIVLDLFFDMFKVRYEKFGEIARKINVRNNISFDEIKANCEIIDAILKKHFNSAADAIMDLCEQDTHDWTNDVIRIFITRAYKEGLLAMLEDLLDPTKNNFRVQSIDQINLPVSNGEMHGDDGHEVWFSDSAIVVDEKQLGEVLDIIAEMKNK